MNKLSTVIHCTAFLVLFILAATADLWLNTNSKNAQPIKITAQDEDELSETTTGLASNTLGSASIPPQVIEQLFQVVLEEKDINRHQWFVTSSPTEKLSILDKLVRRLHTDKQYRLIVNLLQSQEETYLAQVRFYYALALSKIGHSQSAIEQYQAHILAYPNHQSASLNLGLLLKKDKQYAEAITVLTKAVDISSGRKKAKALALLASSEQYIGLKKAAQKHYSKSIEYRPDHAATWLKLANIMVELKYPVETVITTYKRAIALDKKQTNAWLKFGRFTLQQGRFQLAKDALTRALHLSPDHQDVRLQLAWVLSEENSWYAAKPHWSWLQHHSTSFDVRVVASHFYAAITKQSTEQLHPLADDDRGLYASYLIAKLQGAQREDLQTEFSQRLENTETNSDWFYRTRLQLTQLEQMQLGQWQETQLVKKN